MKAKTLLLAALAGAFAAQAAAVTLYSFENDMQGFTVPGWGGTGMTLARSHTGATDGVWALDVDWRGWEWFGVNPPSASVRSAMNSSTRIMMDITVQGNAGPLDWFQVFMAKNYDGGSWTQTKIFELGGGGIAGHYSVVYDYGNWLNYPGNPSWSQFFLTFNGSANAHFFVDNIRVVPEPASIAALGLGAFALLRRRRR